VKNIFFSVKVILFILFNVLMRSKGDI